MALFKFPSNFTPRYTGYSTPVIILIVLLVILAFGLGPIITIWSLNTLFNLGITYTFWTWLATLVLLNAGTNRFISSK